MKYKAIISPEQFLEDLNPFQNGEFDVIYSERMLKMFNLKSTTDKSLYYYQQSGEYALIPFDLGEHSNYWVSLHETGHHIAGYLIFKRGSYQPRDIFNLLHEFTCWLNGEIYRVDIYEDNVCEHCGHEELGELLDCCTGFYNCEDAVNSIDKNVYENISVEVCY